MAQKFKKPLSLEEKQSILSDVDDGIKKKSEIAAKYGIPRSTLSTILKNRYKIEAACVSNKFEPNRKRMRLAKNEDVEIALMKWISEIRSKNTPLTGDILQEKALFLLMPSAWKISKHHLDGYKDLKIGMESYAKRFVVKKIALIRKLWTHS